jgi:hypothetical protein
MNSKSVDVNVPAYERRVLCQQDGHYCPDWDYMAVSAWTTEYDSCLCAKTRLGRIINLFAVWRFNLGWWKVVGIPDLLDGKSPYQPANSLPCLPVDFFVNRSLVQTPEIITAIGIEQQSIKDAQQDCPPFDDFVSGGQ